MEGRRQCNFPEPQWTWNKEMRVTQTLNQGKMFIKVSKKNDCCKHQHTLRDDFRLQWVYMYILMSHPCPDRCTLRKGGATWTQLYQALWWTAVQQRVELYGSTNRNGTQMLWYNHTRTNILLYFTALYDTLRDLDIWETSMSSAETLQCEQKLHCVGSPCIS